MKNQNLIFFVNYLEKKKYKLNDATVNNLSNFDSAIVAPHEFQNQLSGEFVKLPTAWAITRGTGLTLDEWVSFGQLDLA